MPEVGDVGAVMTADDVVVQRPLPGAAAFAAMVAVPVDEQMLWSGPAAAVLTESRRITTVSLLLQLPLVIVQINVLFPNARPVTPLVATVGLVITAAPVVVQRPLPEAGVFPASVAVDTVQIL